MTERPRTWTPLTIVAVGVAVLMTVVAGAAAWQLDKTEHVREVRGAVLVEDLCAVVEPVVPDELGLADGFSRTESREGSEVATCVLSSAGERVLEARLTSYDLLEGDPHGTLDQLLAAACDGLEAQYPDEAFQRDETGCTGRDPGSSDREVLTTVTEVRKAGGVDAIATVTLTHQATPAQVAFYATAISGFITDLPLDLPRRDVEEE